MRLANGSDLVAQDGHGTIGAPLPFASWQLGTPTISGDTRRTRRWTDPSLTFKRQRSVKTRSRISKASTASAPELARL